jgi:hypothetical protein
MATTNRAGTMADSPRAASESIALRWAGMGVFVGMVGGVIGGGAVALAMTRHESAPIPAAAAGLDTTPAVERSPALLLRSDPPPEPPAPVAWLFLGESDEAAPVAAGLLDASGLPLEQPDPLVMDEPPPPPPADDEAPPPRPFDDAEWSDGSYAWEGGDWVWHGGSWMLPPEPGDTIAPAYLESRDDVVIYVAPFWQRPGTSFVAPRLGALPVPLHVAMSSQPSSAPAAEVARSPSEGTSSPPAHTPASPHAPASPHTPASPTISTPQPPASAAVERRLAELHEQEEAQLAELHAFQARQQAELEARERAEQEAAAHRTAPVSPILRTATVTARRRR